MQVGRAHRLTLGARRQQQHNQIHVQGTSKRSIVMLPAGGQKYMWLLLLLLYLALAVQLTVSGGGIHLAAHGSLKSAETVHEPIGTHEVAPLTPRNNATNSTINSTRALLLAAVIKNTAAPPITPPRNTGTHLAIKSQIEIHIPQQKSNVVTKKQANIYESIRQSSDSLLYKRLLEKITFLGSESSSENKLKAAISKCGAKVGGQPSRPVLQNVQNYSYLHNPTHLCSNELLALIAVHSNAKNLVRRATIRRTWGSLRYIGRHRIDVVFFLGRPAPGDATSSGVRDAQLQALIDEESRKFGDIVQLDYTENYRNMTIKHLTVYEWTLMHCPATKYLVKVDDDTFTDVAHLATFLSRGPPHGFYCSATSGARPQRVRRGSKAKWTVTTAEYAEKTYPPYCEGFGYILHAESIPDIYFCSLFKRFFWIDDVYVTGVLAAASNVPLSRFWRGHSYAVMLPSQASEVIMDYIFLTAEQSEFFESVWHRLWYAVLQHSLDVYL